MKKISFLNYTSFVIILLLVPVLLNDCNEPNPIKYPYGMFPDTVVNLNGLNSAYDDYNTSGYQLNGFLPLIFSSNRKSSGGQFDLNQGYISFSFDQENGTFMLYADMSEDVFMSAIINAAQTPLDDLGPYRCFSSYDGYEYLVVSSENSEGNLDLVYFKNLPFYGVNIPAIEGPYPVKLLNTGYDDGYLSFDLNLDSAYFMTNPEGKFDIYIKARPEGKDIGAWFNMDYSASEKVDSINSPEDDKCPMVYNKFMVFTSNRDGGQGGYDLYYSIFRNGKWSAAVNFGPKINSSADEFRPLIGYHPDYKNIFIIFSSNRPGGKGGYDLYFTGTEVPEK